MSGELASEAGSIDSALEQAVERAAKSGVELRAAEVKLLEAQRETGRVRREFEAAKVRCVHLEGQLAEQGALNALAWTEAKPTAPGTYWIYDTNALFGVVEVLHESEDDDWYVAGYPVYIPLDHVHDVVVRYWLGPIPMLPLPEGW